MRNIQRLTRSGSFTITALLASLSATWIAPVQVNAQDAVEPQRVESKQVEPTLVDQRVADLSPLSMSLRDVEASLRVPMDFEEVFRITGQNGQADRFMRSSGALHAVFDQSTYDPLGRAEIPANTMFYIGAPPPTARVTASGSTWSATAGQSDAASTLAYGPSQPNAMRDSINASASVRMFAATSLQQNGQTFSSMTRSIPTSQTGAPPQSSIVTPATTPKWRALPDPDESPTYVNNETYRAQRIRALIKRAADAERNQELSSADTAAESTESQAARGPSSPSD